MLKTRCKKKFCNLHAPSSPIAKNDVAWNAIKSILGENSKSYKAQIEKIAERTWCTECEEYSFELIEA